MKPLSMKRIVSWTLATGVQIAFADQDIDTSKLDCLLLPIGRQHVTAPASRAWKGKRHRSLARALLFGSSGITIWPTAWG
jgi:hypothetical protein